MTGSTLDELYARTRARVQSIRTQRDHVARTSPVMLADHLDPHYARRAHLDVIGDAFRTVATGQADRLLIQTPPQVGKSISAAVWGPFWWLVNHPRHKVVLASYADSLAVTRGRAVRRLVVEHGHRYDLALDVESRAVNDWALLTGGGMRSVGVGAGLTGHSAHLLVCDDPHKDRAEADSLRIRDNIWDWWSSTAVTRLAPSAPIVLIQTRWHRDDLAGRVLEREGTLDEGGRWHVLNMPALATHPDTDPLGRDMGDPLPHPLLDPSDDDALRAHWEDKRATMIVRDWWALCMGDPQPAEGALVDETLMRRQTHTPTPAQPVKSAVAIDPSGGGRDTAGVIGGWLGDDHRVYITDDATLHGTTEQWSQAACLLAADLEAEQIIYETNYGGDQVKWAIKSAWDQLARTRPDDPRFAGLPPQLVPVRARKGKLLRAEPIAQQLSEDRVRLAGHMPDLVGEWCSWQPTDPDSPGRIDASCHLVYGLLPVPGADAVVSSPTGVDRNRITRTPTTTMPGMPPPAGRASPTRIDRGRGR